MHKNVAHREYLNIQETADYLGLAVEDVIHAGAFGEVQICVNLHGRPSSIRKTRMPACDRSTRPMPSAIYELDDETLRFFEMPEGTNFELHGAIQHDEMGWWNVEFDPPVIVNWVDLVVLSEELERFISRGSDLPPGTLEQTKSDIKNVEEDIDPADLPDELDMANQAFRAVSKGFGNKDATFKSRLITYLETTFPKLNGTTVDRIATVANPDKARGRRKRELE